MALLLLAAAAYGTWLVVLAREIWFWGDDFEFLLRRGSVDSVDHGLFAPHNGHWSTMVVLIYRSLYAVFGMTTYLPYVLITIVIHLSISLTLFLLLERQGANRWVALLAGWFVLFIPLGFDNILWDATMNNTGALLFGFLAVYALVRTGHSRRGLRLAWAALIVALMFSGTGISAVVLATAFATTEKGAKFGAKVAAVPAAAFLIWWLAVGRDGNSLAWHPGQVPQFVWAGLTKTLGNAIAVPEAGPVLFIMLFLLLVTDHTSRPGLRHLAWAGLVAATCQLLLEAVTRGILGVDIATNARYAYFTVVLLAPMVGVAADRLWRLTVEPRWLAAAAAGVLTVGYTVHCLDQLSTWSEGWAAVTTDLQGVVLATSETVADGQTPLSHDLGIHHLTPELLGRPEVRAKLPRKDVTPRQRLQSETEFNIGVRSTTYDRFAPVFIDLTSGWKQAEAAPGPGCRTYIATKDDPLIQVATQEGTEIGVTSDATQVVTVLERDDELGPIRIWGVKPGPVYIAATAKDAVLKVSFNAGGEYTICKQ